MDLLRQCSDQGTKVLETEAAKQRADRVHAAETLRLNSLLQEMRVGRLPPSAREQPASTQAFLEKKRSAEACLAAEAERLKQVSPRPPS